MTFHPPISFNQTFTLVIFNCIPSKPTHYITYNSTCLCCYDSCSTYALHILNCRHEYGNIIDTMTLLKQINKQSLLLPYEQMYIHRSSIVTMNSFPSSIQTQPHVWTPLAHTPHALYQLTTNQYFRPPVILLSTSDIEEEITGFKYAPDRVALPHARWCWNVWIILCYVIFWMVDLYKKICLFFFKVLGTTATNVSFLASVLM